MSRVRQARPFTVFLLGLACLIGAVLLAFLQVAEPVFWLLYVVAVVAIGGAYLYFAVSLIESGRNVIGWAIVWLPTLALTVTTSPAIGVIPAIVVASIEAAIGVGVVMLVLRAARWAECRFNLPVHFA